MRIPIKMDIKISSLRGIKAILGWIFLLFLPVAVLFYPTLFLNLSCFFNIKCSLDLADITEIVYAVSKLTVILSFVGFVFTSLLLRRKEQKKTSWNILYLLLVETLNRFVTNYVCKATTPRPRAFSLWSHIPKPTSKGEQGPVSDYTAWPSLTDKSFSTRHLPPVSHEFIEGLPKDKPPTDSSLGNITKLFIRKEEMTKDRSTTLFMFFAQWLTDSVLRVDPNDRRKNTSNHNIDLCQIYGLKESTATILRSGSDGKLRSKIVKGEEFPDDLGSVGSNEKWEVKEIYKDLPYVKNGVIWKVMDNMMKQSPKRRKREENFYATGLERGNSSIGYVAISTLFLREHNRICNKLKAGNANWDDERLFQTARNINIVLLIKLLIVDYINHIVGCKLFMFDRSFAERQQWYRTPWISLEFDMLYRWHGLIPDIITIDGTEYDHKLYLFNNILLEAKGLNKIITASSQNLAGKISLKNVPSFMAMAEYSMIKMGRDFRLASYNDYRKHFGLKNISSFEKLTDNEELSNELKKLYGDISKLDLIVGLFAEKSSGKKLYGELMYTMVAYDALTQIYTNPLLASNVYNKDTFTQYGLDLIDATNSIQDLVDRNNQTDSKVEAYFENKKT